MLGVVVLLVRSPAAGCAAAEEPEGGADTARDGTDDDTAEGATEDVDVVGFTPWALLGAAGCAAGRPTDAGF